MMIVVTGATGNVGRPLVSELAAAGAEVRAVTREPQTAGFPDGVQTVSSAADALAGASAVFLNSRALGDDLAGVVALARRSGVTKLVALSAINADDDFSRQPSRFRGDRNKEVEQLAVDSGLPWVSLRPSVFASNFGGMWSAQLRAGDVVHRAVVERDQVPRHPMTPLFRRPAPAAPLTRSTNNSPRIRHLAEEFLTDFRRRRRHW